MNQAEAVKQQETVRPDVAALRSQSHGRGGAGNINAKPAKAVGAGDLSTPTIKGTTYTTGRGGTGNMVSNDSPTASRAAQDVDAPPHLDKAPQGTYHWGRGGEGNKMMVGAGEERHVNARNQSKERRASFKEMMAKGKEMLGGKKREGTPTSEKNSSAIEED